MTDELPIETDCQHVAARLRGAADLVLIDCREPDEYATAHIAGSLLMPMSQLAARLGDLGPYRDAEIIVHCHHGVRSLNVVHWLRGQGYSQAQSMAGGIDAWSQQVDPSVPRY